MIRQLVSWARLASILLVALASGCASGLIDGDRFYLAGDLARAETAYREYLTGGRAGGDAEARARYRLGLIYALPGSELHDWEMASHALRTLLEERPDSAWARQASLLLSLHDDRTRLEQEIELRDSRVSALLSEVVSLRRKAHDAGTDAEDQKERLDQLTVEIAELKRSIGQLGEQLAAREQELEQIKRIDLQTPP